MKYTYIFNEHYIYLFLGAGASAQISAKAIELQRLKNELNGKHIKVATYNVSVT